MNTHTTTAPGAVLTQRQLARSVTRLQALRQKIAADAPAPASAPKAPAAKKPAAKKVAAKKVTPKTAAKKTSVKKK